MAVEGLDGVLLATVPRLAGGMDDLPSAGGRGGFVLATGGGLPTTVDVDDGDGLAGFPPAAGATFAGGVDDDGLPATVVGGLGIFLPTVAGESDGLPPPFDGRGDFPATVVGGLGGFLSTVDRLARTDGGLGADVPAAAAYRRGRLPAAARRGSRDVPTSRATTLASVR